MYFCGACYIFRNYYKSVKKESYEKSNDWINDDYDDDDDDGYYAADGDGNNPDVITNVKL